MSDAALAERLAAYCAHRLRDEGVSRARVTGLQRIFGGASRETWRFSLHAQRAGGEDVLPLVLRRDPGASLIDTERRIEFAAYRAFAGTDVPVPRVLWLEEDPAPLDHPFFVMEQVTGCESGPMRLMAEPFRTHHAAIAEQKWTILARIATAPIAPLAALMPTVAPGAAWQRELDHWATILAREAPTPQPIAAAAIRWLRAHPPPPAQRIAIVHADYRTGNLLIDPAGRIRAVLDWEMAHLGDPLEDLAWGLNRAWCFQGDDRVGGLVPRAQAIDTWCRASGLAAEPAALHWWELFSCVKGQAIWQTAANAMQSGANRDLMMALAAWMLANTQDRAILELMGRLA